MNETTFEAIPAIDVTDPAFAVPDDAETVARWRAAYLAPAPRPAAPTGPAPTPQGPMPELIRRMFAPEGDYLDGLATYLLKVGEDNLPANMQSPIERALVATPNAMSLRIRLQQIAHLLAIPLEAGYGSQTVRMLSIGGGTAIEALNALIVARRHRAGDFPAVRIEILDVDSEATRLGEALLAALQAPGAPLAGLPVTLDFTPFSWSEPHPRTPVGAGETVVASSEGALFEYGSDADISGTLAMLRAMGPVPVAGSVIRGDAAGEAMAKRSPFALRSLGLEAIAALAARSGYHLANSREGVASDQFLLQPA